MPLGDSDGVPGSLSAVLLSDPYLLERAEMPLGSGRGPYGLLGVESQQVVQWLKNGFES